MAANCEAGRVRDRRHGEPLTRRPRESPGVAPVVVKAYDQALWLVQRVEKYPRSHRFTIGDRVVGSALDLLLLLVDAAYASEKRATLQAASRQVNGLRFLLRLSHDLRLLPTTSHLFAVEKLDEIGRMVGGWLRAETAS